MVYQSQLSKPVHTRACYVVRELWAIRYAILLGYEVKEHSRFLDIRHSSTPAKQPNHCEFCEERSKFAHTCSSFLPGQAQGFIIVKVYRHAVRQGQQPRSRLHQQSAPRQILQTQWRLPANGALRTLRGLARTGATERDNLGRPEAIARNS